MLSHESIMKKSSKLSLLTAGIAGTLLATSVASVALTACTTQTTPDSSQEQYNWFETKIDWSKPETYSKLYKDNQGVYYTSSAMTTVVAVDNTPTPDGQSRAFSGTEIVLPDSVITISGYMEMVNGVATPKGAFEGLTTLKTIKLGNNVKTIGAQAFKDCPLIQEINLPTTTTNIGSFAFSGCENLETINLSNITTIGTQAFANTLKLKTLNFGDQPKINKIGNGAFMNSGLSGKLDLSTATKATNLYEIGSYAFSGTGLTEVVLPSNLTSLGAGVFQDCKQLVTVTDLNKTQVKIIKPSTFQGCIELKNVSFPNKLLSIGDNAFNNAKKLETLDLSNTDINTFGNNSFQDTTGLKTIDLPDTDIDTLTVIGSGAFLNSGITRLAKKSAPISDAFITLPATVGKLGNGAFANTKIKGFDMSAVTSKTLTTLPADFFNNATSLETVKLSNVIKTIGENAFAGATNLKTIDLSNTVVETIGANVFSNASQLQTVVLPNTIKVIGENAFKNATNLKTVTTPNQTIARATVENKVQFGSNLKTIGNNAFGNSGITEVALSGSGLTEIGTNVFSNASQLKTVTLPTSLKTIKNGAFNNDPTLSTVNFGSLSNLETIEDNNFSNSAISEVDLSSSASLKGLNGENLFTNMSQLTTVKIPSSFNKLNDQSELTNSTGGSISDKVFTKQKGSGQVELTTTVTQFTLANGTTSIQQSEFFKEHTGELDLSKSSTLTTIKQNTFNNPSISKLILPGDNKISFDLGNVTEKTQAKDVAPIYWDASSGKPDSLQEISYTAKATKTRSSRNKREAESQVSSAQDTPAISEVALQTIVNVMNTYSRGPEGTDTVKNLSEWNSATSGTNHKYNGWIDEDLTKEKAKMWSSDQINEIKDITKPGQWHGNPTLYKKHNGITWKLTYDSNSNSITLQTKFAKLYRASSTNPTDKTTEDKQVYFKETIT